MPTSTPSTMLRTSSLSVSKACLFLKQKVNKKGFTLIELMVAIAIVAIMATVGMVVYSTAQKGGRISKRVQDLEALKTALELYKSSTGAYPINSSSWACINMATSGISTLVPTYMPVLPKDPSGSCTSATAGTSYLYLSDTTGSEYKLRTSIPTTEMSWENYKQQPSLVDPARDTNTTVNCIVETTGADPAAPGWAIYSGSIACSY